MRFHLALSILLIASVVFAAGGGGGGDQGSGSPPPSGGSSGGGGSSEEFSSAVCLGTGSVKFFINPIPEEIVAKHDETGESFTVLGGWSGNTFESDENQFVKKGTYAINGRKVSCPGLVYTCLTTKIIINSCEKTAEGIKAKITLVNITDTADLKYEVKSGKNIYFKTKTAMSTEMKALVEKPMGNSQYETEVPIDATHFQVSNNRCTGRSRVFAVADCVENKVSHEFRCFDLLSKKDRIECRLLLSEEEYEKEQKILYLPEECRELEDTQDQCIQRYKAVYKCWKFPVGPNRISCVKGELNLGDLGEEKKRVTSLEGKNQFEKKVLNLVKFRLYDLEERAEELMKNGASREKVSELVVKLEDFKIEITKVATNQERKAVILKARKAWKEFAEGVRDEIK